MTTETRYTKQAGEGLDVTPEQEQALLGRLATGDTEAFWVLWEHYRHTELAHSCLQWMGGSREDADDALSSASLRAHQRLPRRAHEISNVKAWLRRLLYNHCMNIHKTRRSRRRYFQPVPGTLRPVQWSPAAGGASVRQESVEDEVLHRELRGYLRGTIHTLPDRLRDPVILYYIQGLPHRDIAVQLALTPVNVRKRLQQARQILHDKIVLYLRGEAESEP